MTLRARINEIVEGRDPRYGRAFTILSNGVIVLAAVSYAAGTMPDLSPGVRLFLIWLDTGIIATFALDYVVRLTCAPRPLAYARSFWGIIDLLAFLPAVLFAGTEFQSARLLRLVLVARLLKLARLSRALRTLGAALVSVRDQLIVFLLLVIIVLFLASVGIYHFEHDAQPDVFKSVPHAMWWAVATLSTVGYGDIYPVTPGGKIFTAFVLLVGLAVIAVPTGLISAALVAKTSPKRKGNDP